MHDAVVLLYQFMCARNAVLLLLPVSPHGYQLEAMEGVVSIREKKLGEDGYTIL